MVVLLGNKVKFLVIFACFLGMEEPPAVPLEGVICTGLISMCLSFISMEHKWSELGFI